VIFGAVTNDNVAELNDLNKRETVVLGSLAFFVLLLGLWPEPLVHVMNDSLVHVIEQATTSKLGN
jgi:NADH-quinone oxidoreductase subunit M